MWTYSAAEPSLPWLYVCSDLAVNSKKRAEVKLRITLLYKQLLLVAQLLF